VSQSPIGGPPQLALCDSDKKNVAANHKLIEQSEWGNRGSGVTAGGNASN